MVYHINNQIMLYPTTLGIHFLTSYLSNLPSEVSPAILAAT